METLTKDNKDAIISHPKKKEIKMDNVTVKDARIGLRVNSKDKEIIEAYAKAKGMSVSDSLVELARIAYSEMTNPQRDRIQKELNRLSVSGSYDYIAITDILGSVSDSVISKSEKLNIVKNIFGKSLSEIKSETIQKLNR